MKKIKICNFKGINSLPELNFTKEINGDKKDVNLLLYAENGGGKTSISEAIRFATFAKYIKEEKIPPYMVDEDRKAAKRDWLNSYLHNKSNNLFSIELDDVKISSNDIDIQYNSNVFIFGRSQLIEKSSIYLDDIINKTYFSSLVHYDELRSSYVIDLVLEEVNRILEADFKETIRVCRVESKNIIIGVQLKEDEIIKEDINIKVNEANQNLIKILIFITYLKILQILQANDNFFVVFDDVMSSLDLTNRIILARIIIDLGKEFQILLMTHNVGFYNLIKHISGVNNTNENWSFLSMYKFDGNHYTNCLNDDSSVNALLKEFNGKIQPTNGQAINSMRKKFENLLHEFAKILTLGIQEETSDLIQRICNTHRGIYCYIEGNKVYNHFDLINEILKIVNVCPIEQLKSKIIKVIEKYDNKNLLPWISETIQHLRTYQTVVLHQGSHDQIGTLPIISQKEIDITLELMRNLEQITKRNSTNYPYFI